MTTPCTVETIAGHVGGRLAGKPDLVISGIAGTNEAQAGSLTFIADSSHAGNWPRCRATAALVSERITLPDRPGDDHAVIIVPDAELALAKALELFELDESQPQEGVHPTAVVHERSIIGAAARIGPHVSIAQDCIIGEGVVLHAGVRLYDGAKIGAGSVIHANCVIRSRCRLGRGVVLHQNVSIGADGFGYRPAPDGSGLIKMPHIGTVVIEDGVEIGAGSCVDRAKFGQTVIGAGTKIDNLVQIGHNCRIGRCCVIAAMTAIGGSAEIGDGVAIGGHVGIADHRKIGSGARIGAKSGVMHDIPAGEDWLGIPAGPAKDTLRQWAAVRKLHRFASRSPRRTERGTQGPQSAPEAPDS